MKTNLSNRMLRRLVPVGVCAGLACCVAQAQVEPSEPEKPKAEKPAKRAPAMAPFLGVALAPIDEAVAAQINLPEGVGVLVGAVLPDSPAAKAGVLRHDVLHYFNDQLLVNEPQLHTLVRQAGIGTEVTLKLLRKGKEETVVVRLGEREEREAWEAPYWPGRGPGEHRAGPFGIPAPPADPRTFKGPLSSDAFANRVRELSERMKRLEGRPEAEIRKEIERFRKEMEELARERDGAAPRKTEPTKEKPLEPEGEEASSAGPRTKVWKDDKGGIRVEVRTDGDASDAKAASVVTATADGKGNVVVTQTNSTRVAWNDGEGSGELRIEDGKKTLTAKDADGKEVFSGPVDTEEQLEHVPPKVRERMKRIESNVKVQASPAPRKLQF